MCVGVCVRLRGDHGNYWPLIRLESEEREKVSAQLQAMMLQQFFKFFITSRALSPSPHICLLCVRLDAYYESQLVLSKASGIRFLSFTLRASSIFILNFFTVIPCVSIFFYEDSWHVFSLFTVHNLTAQQIKV